MISKDFEKDFKLFTRFIKEEGKYKFLMDYLFPPGRTLNNFRECVEKALQGSYCYDFGDILHISPILGQSYEKLGNNHWNQNIKDISDKFQVYYRLKKHL